MGIPVMKMRTSTRCWFALPRIRTTTAVRRKTKLMSIRMMVRAQRTTMMKLKMGKRKKKKTRTTRCSVIKFDKPTQNLSRPFESHHGVVVSSITDLLEIALHYCDYRNSRKYFTHSFSIKNHSNMGHAQLYKKPHASLSCVCCRYFSIRLKIEIKCFLAKKKKKKKKKKS